MTADQPQHPKLPLGLTTESPWTATGKPGTAGGNPERSRRANQPQRPAVDITADGNPPEEVAEFVRSVTLPGRSREDYIDQANAAISDLLRQRSELQAELHEWRQWGREWVAARREREGWVPVPGTMPPAHFNVKPRELNRRLDALLEAWRKSLAAQAAPDAEAPRRDR